MATLANLPGYVNATTPLEYGSILLSDWSPGITSLALKKRYLVHLLWKMNLVEEDAETVEGTAMAGKSLTSVREGGDQFKERLRISLNTNVDTYSPTENIRQAEGGNEITHCYAAVRALCGSIVISHIRAAKVNGKAALVNLMMSEKNSIVEAISNVLSKQGVWADGTGNNNKDLQGIPTWVKTTASQAYGGITPTDLDDSTMWDNIIATDTAVGAFATSSEGLDAVDDVYSQIVERSSEPPDLWCCRAWVWNKWKKSHQVSITANQPLTTVVAKAIYDLGIPAFLYAGAPVVIDADVPYTSSTNQRVYALTLKKFKLKVLSKANFKFYPFIRSPGVQGESSDFQLFCNFQTNDRRGFGVIPSITG